ncbi:hypothetical protein HYV88_01360 [Candidatus Woesearchaeota archaeon]|nr:hypothetical protein [Candidatus Woesearchaeota archaeon]
MNKETVTFSRLWPEKKGTRDRSNGRYYLLEALVNDVGGVYRIAVNQSVGGIDEKGRVLFDPQIENTGGQFPDITYLEKIGKHLCNGEGIAIRREWRRQYFTDVEIRKAIGEYGDPDIVRVYEEARAQYGL